MAQTRILYFLLAFCGTVSQGLWINPLGTEAILIVDIPLFLLFVLGKSTKTKDPKCNIVLVVMIVFLLWPIVSAFGAINQQAAFVNMITNLRAFLIALAIMRYVNSKKEMEYLMIGIGAGLLFQGMIALYQFRFGYAGFGFLGEGAASWRTSGTLGHPNVLAMYTMMITPLMYRFALFVESKNTTLYLFAFIVGVGALFTSQGRACWVGFAISMILFLLYDIKSKRVLTKRTRRVWAVIVVVVVIGAVRYSPIIINRFTGAEASIVGRGTSSRVYLALDAIRIISEHPVVGVGLENYRLHAAEEIVGDKFVHCTYLLITAETGIIGGIIFIILLFLIIRYNFKIIKSEDHFISNVAIGALTAIIAFSIAILPSPDYRIPWVKNHIWLLFGIVLALGKMDYWAKRRRDRIKTIAEIKRRSQLLRTKGTEQQQQKNNNPNITSKGRRGR